MTETARAQLVRYLRREINAFDPEVDEADAGCIECTCGTVPIHLETGLCERHEAEAILLKMKRTR
jgi:hypothetical protein